MIHVTFNGSLCGSLKQYRPSSMKNDKVVLLQLILEVGELSMRSDSEINNLFYSVVAGKNAYSIFRKEVENKLLEIENFDELEEICFWIDFNDVRQHLNLAYFIHNFKRFKNLYICEYDFNKFCEKPQERVYDLFKKKPMSSGLIYYLKEELSWLENYPNINFKTTIDKELAPVKDDYFDKYIFEFLTEKPKPCQKIIGEIFGRFGRLVMSFDQIVIRLWQLVKEGVVEKIETPTQYGLFFEYQFKLGDHINMERDS